MVRILLTLLAGLAVCAAGPAPERLVIEQQGPADAALRPFTIEVGSPAASTRDAVYVHPATFKALLATAREQKTPQGEFYVTVHPSNQPTLGYSISRDGLAMLMGPVVAMFQVDGKVPPSFVAALANTVGR